MQNLQFMAILSTIALFLATCSGNPSKSSDHNDEPNKEVATTLQIQTLLKETLALAENVEVIMSHVEIPKNTSLPMHFHPGEEFAYILEGSGVLELKGKSKTVVHAGDMGLVPFKHHHTFSTLEEGARLLVFRVHEKGQPERVLVE